jgi:xanthine/CO dehydrogenase XdhC/CoxF family maturation factor
MINQNAGLRQAPGVRLDTSLEALLAAGGVAGRSGVLATIVSTAGSTYAKPGARMLIGLDGSHVGLLSGGCLEGDLAEHAATVQADGVARCIAYDMRGPDDELFGIGAGCEGAMRILLEPTAADLPATAALVAAGNDTSCGHGAALIVVHESPDVALGTYGAHAALPEALLGAAHEALAGAVSCDFDADLGNGMTRAFVQYLAPPPRLLVCGGGDDAVPMVEAACRLGWRVTVVDHRPRFARAARFPGAEVIEGTATELAARVDLEDFHAAVVMSHHLASDAAYLAAIARAYAPGYVGLLGPSARRKRLATDLGELATRLQDRLHAPVGLDIGAVTPQGIALAIVAEIHAWLRGHVLVREQQT